MISKAVVQAVLISGSETWVLNSHMGRALGGWGGQYRVARRISVKQPWWLLVSSWEYPYLDISMQEAGFEEVEAYLLRRKNTAAQYIVKQPILDLCEEMVRMPGTWVAKRW